MRRTFNIAWRVNSKTLPPAQGAKRTSSPLPWRVVGVLILQSNPNQPGHEITRGA